MILMIEKLKEFFDGELDLEDIRKVSDVSNIYGKELFNDVMGV